MSKWTFASRTFRAFAFASDTWAGKAKIGPQHVSRVNLARSTARANVSKTVTRSKAP